MANEVEQPRLKIQGHGVRGAEVTGHMFCATASGELTVISQTGFHLLHSYTRYGSIRSPNGVLSWYREGCSARSMNFPGQQQHRFPGCDLCLDLFSQAHAPIGIFL